MTTSPATTSPGFEKLEIFLGNNATPFEADQTLLEGYIETFSSRYDRPASVFCSRELESGLISFVETEMACGAGFPSDEAIRLRGREILSCDKTAADDPDLLARFKAWMIRLRHQQPVTMPCDINIDLNDAEIDSMLADANFDMILTDL